MTSCLCHLKLFFFILSMFHATISHHQQTAANLQSHNLIYRETSQYIIASYLATKVTIFDIVGKVFNNCYCTYMSAI